MMKATWILAGLMTTMMGSAWAKGGTIKIGAILGVTGPAANLGGPEARTLEMVVDELNKKGGIAGDKVEVVLKDSGASPEKAMSFAKQLIEEEKVFAIIGPSTSGETLKIKALAESSKTILLSCASAEAIVKPLAKHVFKVPQSDSDAVRRIFEQMKKMGVSKIGVLSSNTGFGKAGKEQLQQLAPSYGIQLVANEVYDKDATDLTALVTKVKGSGAQALVNWSIEPAQAIVIKNARQIGVTIPIFQSHGFANIQYAKAAGPAAEGVIFPAARLMVADSLPAHNKQKAVVTKYKHDYEQRYKEQVSTFGGHVVDAFLLLTKAIEKAGSTDREKVRSALENLQGVVGTAGVFNMSPKDHNGLGPDAFEMLIVKNGKFVVYAEPVAKK